MSLRNMGKRQGKGTAPTSINLPSNWASVAPSSRPQWPTHVNDYDIQSASYFNDMTDAILALRNDLAGFRTMIDDLVWRIEQMEDELAGKA